MELIECSYTAIEMLNSKDAFDFFLKNTKLFIEILKNKKIPDNFGDFIQFVYNNKQCWSSFLYLLDNVIISDFIVDEWILQTLLFMKNDKVFYTQYGQKTYQSYYNYDDEDNDDTSILPSQEEIIDCISLEWLLPIQFLTRLFTKLNISKRVKLFENLDTKRINSFVNNEYVFDVNYYIIDRNSKDRDYYKKKLPILKVQLTDEESNEIESLRTIPDDGEIIYLNKENYQIWTEECLKCMIVREKKYYEKNKNCLKQFFQWYFYDVLQQINY